MLEQNLMVDLDKQLNNCLSTPLKGGNPAAPSGTATLLRLRPSYQSHLKQLLPEG